MIDRTVAPKTHTITHIPFQKPEINQLENKIDVYSIRKTNDKTAHIDFIFDAGSLKTSKIIAQLTGDLLLSGTAVKSSDDIEEAIDRLGGYIGTRISTEKAKISIFGLKEFIVPITQIVVDAIKNVNFNPKEINQLLQARKKKMAIQLEKVSVQARRSFLSDLFQNSPYGDLANLEDFDAINPKDLIAFHHEKYRSGLQYISVVGELDDAQLESIKELGNQFSKEEVVPIDYNYSYSPNSIHIEKEKAVQSAIRVGKILFNKKHPDYKKFLVVDTILGGYFGSRLMTSIREEKGYTYGIGSGVAQLKETGYFFISTEVAKEFKELTIEAIHEEITKLQTEEVGKEELTLVKNYIVGQILDQSDGAHKMMSRFLSVHQFGLDFSYYNELIQQVNEITPKEIMALAQKYLKWEDLTIVSVG